MFAVLSGVALAGVLLHYGGDVALLGDQYDDGYLDFIRPHAAVLGLLVLCFAITVYFLGAMAQDKTVGDQSFQNGLNGRVLLNVAINGLSIDVLLRFLCETCRKRLYLGWKRYIFFGREHWVVGHPAIVAAMFGKNHTHWYRLDQNGTKTFYYQPVGDKKFLNIAMLYTGTDSRWRKGRQLMSPYFYNTDFTDIDSDIDKVLTKHLNEVVDRKGGQTELLTLTLRSTIDLICQLIFGVELQAKEFDLLVASLSDYIVPGYSCDDTRYPGGLDEYEYHQSVGRDLGNKSLEGTLGAIIRDSNLPKELKEANYAFYLEALTPAFASFWAVCHVLMDKKGEKVDLCKEDPVYRQMCIKESLRMYPPVPALWPRQAMKDMEFENPIFDDLKPPKPRTFFGKLIGLSEPPENQKIIKIKKGTQILILPAALHYDTRFWFEPTQFNPDRWENDPFVLENKDGEAEGNIHHTSAKVCARATMTFGAVAAKGSEKITDAQSRSECMRQAELFLDNQSNMKHNIRAHMFGKDHEKQMAEAAQDVMNECTDPAFFEMQKWTFLPFAMGAHTCMGRRLALRLVDAILWNTLEYDANFYNGVVPSMFTSKPWYDRITATAAVYNMPADPAYISVKRPAPKAAGKNSRVSMVAMSDLKADKTGVARQSKIAAGFLSKAS